MRTEKQTIDLKSGARINDDVIGHINALHSISDWFSKFNHLDETHKEMAEEAERLCDNIAYYIGQFVGIDLVDCVFYGKESRNIKTELS